VLFWASKTAFKAAFPLEKLPYTLFSELDNLYLKRSGILNPGEGRAKYAQ